MPRLRRVGRQVVGRHLLGVVDAAGDDRLVGVALQEVDDHLLADARDVRSTPQFLPAHGCDTRTQQELFSSFLPSRSQWNCTFTRPYLSVKISSPRRADDHRRLRPLHERLAACAARGRNCCVDGIAENSQLVVAGRGCRLRSPRTCTRADSAVTRYSPFWSSRGWLRELEQAAHARCPARSLRRCSDSKRRLQLVDAGPRPTASPSAVWT